MGKKRKGNSWNDEEEGSKNKRQYETTQEDLGEYIHVCRPGVIVIIVSLLAMLIAVLVWGFVGTLPVTETVTGVVVDYRGYDRWYPDVAAQLKDGAEMDKKSTTEDAGADSTQEQSDENPEGQSDGSGGATQGEKSDIVVFCFVDASRFNGQAIKEIGDNAVLKMADQQTFEGTVETRYLEPVSREEAKSILFDNEWVLDKCVKQDYNWMLVIRPKQDLTKYAFTLSEVTLLTEEVHPIRFLIK